MSGSWIARGGRIAALLPYGGVPAGIAVEEAGDSVIMPGLVDTHVHINEPGRAEWEGFETATKAAAAGGITTLVDMPLNSTPVTTTVPAFREKLSAAEGKLWVDCGFHGGVVPGNAQELQGLIGAGVLGFKAFLVHSGIDEFPHVTEHDLRLAMPLIARSNLPLLVHCELAADIPQAAGRGSKIYGDYLSSRPSEWEHDAIALMIRLCRAYRCRTHIVHLSSADALPILTDARSEELPLTVETCPHYLYFTAEEIPDGDTRYKCAPPIRGRGNRERLWGAARDGIIDMIVSDHSPSTPGLKCMETGNFQQAWGGIASLQFGLSIIWTEARQRGFTIADIARLMSRQPAALVNLGQRKGSIAPGFDADFVVWNPDEEFTIEPPVTHHRHKLTPYEGRTLRGRVTGTYLRGIKIFDHGSLYHIPFGKPLRSSQ